MKSTFFAAHVIWQNKGRVRLGQKDARAEVKSGQMQPKQTQSKQQKLFTYS